MERKIFRGRWVFQEVLKAVIMEITAFWSVSVQSGLWQWGISHGRWRDCNHIHTNVSKISSITIFRVKTFRVNMYFLLLFWRYKLVPSCIVSAGRPFRACVRLQHLFLCTPTEVSDITSSVKRLATVEHNPNKHFHPRLSDQSVAHGVTNNGSLLKKLHGSWRRCSMLVDNSNSGGLISKHSRHTFKFLVLQLLKPGVRKLFRRDVTFSPRTKIVRTIKKAMEKVHESTATAYFRKKTKSLN
jgi:hypothetical protein